eukprot:168403-Rhodomonas_salina.1
MVIGSLATDAQARARMLASRLGLGLGPARGVTLTQPRQIINRVFNDHNGRSSSSWRRMKVRKPESHWHGACRVRRQCQSR